MRFLQIKRRARLPWLLCVFCALCVCALQAFALDREAFSITNYNLTLQVDPEQHRLGARGRITLRNDSSSPQKIAVLQISSSLDWRAIKAGDKAVQFVRQPYTSDIDHTGALSEAIVTLPREIAPQATVDLDIAYEGVILLDATRLMRIGTPDNAAKTSDWDQIGPDFSAVRGAGYVAWYPIATESANLSEEDDLSEVLARWKARESESEMLAMFESTRNSPILFSGTKTGFVVTAEEPVKIGAFAMIHPRTAVPTFVIADYQEIQTKKGSAITYLSGKSAMASSIADLIETLDPFPELHGLTGIQVAELPYPSAAPFVSQNLLLMPFRPSKEEDRRTLVYALARQKAASPYGWVSEGLAHFAQVLDIESQHGRVAALEYLKAHRSLVVDLEKAQPSTDSPSKRALVDMNDDIRLQEKAMWVWSMLRDMVGDAGLNLVLFSYQAPDDTKAAYMPELFAKRTTRDLQWFFDDWVYHDRGLPNFKVESAYARKASENSFLVTITLDNLGRAGAEVPFTVKFMGGETTKRLEVRAKSKAVIRVETPAAPQEIVVNDGSVPESDITNNSFKIESVQAK